MKNITITAILIAFCFGLGGSIYQTTNNQETIQEPSHFEKFVRHEKMRDYSWMVIKYDPDQKWKIRKRKLIRKE